MFERSPKLFLQFILQLQKRAPNPLNLQNFCDYIACYICIETRLKQHYFLWEIVHILFGGVIRIY